MIEALRPDLVFLDVQLPDLTGFEIIEKLSCKPNIIFTTAYEQYAIRAFETFSIDYLLKPIKEDRLKQSIVKLKQFRQIDQPVDTLLLQEMIRQFKAPQKATALPIRTGDRITLLRFEQIVYLQADDKYVFVFMSDGQKHLTDQSLQILLTKLPAHFYRIQKSYIINKEKIKEMHRHFNSRFLFIMDDKSSTRLTSGRTYFDEIRDEFGL
jgi:two-component system LytT family response regulator